MKPKSTVAAVLAVLLASALVLSCSGTSVPPADIVLRGGKIATVDEAFSMAQAVAVSGGKIVRVGSDADIEPYIGASTTVIGLAGRLAVPGLIDAHAHMLGYGAALASIDFRGVDSFDKLVAMVADKAKTLPPGEWIQGESWDQNLWEGGEFPFHDALSKAVHDHPVWLTRVDGHAGIANAKAMEIAGVTKASKDPSGGEILRKPGGEPSGVFIDRAMGLVGRHIPDMTDEQIMDALVAASDNCLSVGLTGIHDAGVSPGTIALYKRLIDEGRLNIRVWAMLSNTSREDVAEYMRENMIKEYGGYMLAVNSIKLFMDGALGSRGAAMFEDYSDRPGYTGLLTLSYERALEISRAALEAGGQVCTHAIGDKANHLIIDAYEQALKEHPNPDHRFRIEHAQVVAPEDFQRVADHGILPSMQPTHATSDMYWAEARVGAKRVRGAYAWQEFLRRGCIIPCGSDFPVEKNNPMLGFYAALTRRDPSGYPEGGWFADQRMTREQALRGFTIWAARAAFQENVLGSIEEGKLADIVVLSKDILTVPPQDILDTVPDYVIVGGDIKYTR